MQAFQALTTAIQECQETGQMRAGEPLLIANTLWAFVHGTATLALDNHLKSPLPLGEYLSQSLDLLFDGFSPDRPETQQPARY